MRSCIWKQGLPGGSVSKESTCNAGDPGSIPGSGRSPGEGNGNPLQYSCLENPMDRGAWWATWLSDWTIIIAMEKHRWTGEIHAYNISINSLQRSLTYAQGHILQIFSFSSSCVWFKENPLPIICEWCVFPLIIFRSQLPSASPTRGTLKVRCGRSPRGACGFGLESDPSSSGSFCNWEGLVVFGKSNSLTVHPMTMKALLKKKIISFFPL